MAGEAEIRKLAASRLGQRLGEEWRLRRLIGVGGMSAVYAAVGRDGAHGAVKMLHERHAADADLRRRFAREIFLTETLHHVDVPRVVAHGEHGGHLYFVMELLEGLSVDRCMRLAGGRLRPLDVLDVAERLLSVLAEAHARGIVHRDIKPSNLFRTRPPARLKILDFGVAGGLRHPCDSAPLTATGTIVGTPYFMAPEQARGRWDEVDAQSDLFAVGATLFNLLSGRYVHARATAEETFGAAMLEPPPKLEQVVAGLPPALLDLVNRALAFEKRERWPDALTMASATGDVRADVERSFDGVRFFDDASTARSFGGLREGGHGEEPVTEDTQGEGVLGALAFARSGRTLVVVHTAENPSDVEWTQWMTRMSLHDYEHVLIATAGGGPNALQRRLTNEFWRGKELPRFSILTESRAVAGIISVFNWFLDGRLKAFHPKDTAAALSYLEVAADERPALLDTVSRLRSALDGHRSPH